MRQLRLSIRPMSLALVGILSLVGCAPELDVFHSPNDDGLSRVVPQFPTETVDRIDLNLWINRKPVAMRTLEGSTPAREEVASEPPESACSGRSDAPGDEICSWKVTIEVVPGARIADFEAEPGVVYHREERRLRATGGKPTHPDLDPERIGRLAVEIVDASLLPRQEAVVQVSGDYVTAALELEPVPLQGVTALVR